MITHFEQDEGGIPVDWSWLLHSRPLDQARRNEMIDWMFEQGPEFRMLFALECQNADCGLSDFHASNCESIFRYARWEKVHTSGVFLVKDEMIAKKFELIWG